jgi:3-dehydroquinate synthase II
VLLSRIIFNSERPKEVLSNIVRSKNKELIVKLLVAKEKLNEFLSKVSHVSLISGDPSVITNKNFRTIFHSQSADLVVCSTLDTLRENKNNLHKSVGYIKMISTKEDLEEILLAFKYGVDFCNC